MTLRSRGISLAAVFVIAAGAIGVGVGSTAWWLRRPQPAAEPSAVHAGHDMGTMAGPTVAVGAADGTDVAGMGAMPGMSHDAPTSEGVYISPARQQLIGVRTSAVAVERLSAPVSTVGALAYDESRVTHVHTKIAGWVDRLFVDFVGKPVQRGQPLFTIYSPELVAMQHEYLLARRAQMQLDTSRFEETRQGAASLVAASRRRLELWDISDAQIADLERAFSAI